MSIVIKNEDCIQFLKSIPDNSVDLVIADPPYNIGYDGGDGWDSLRSLDEYLAWAKEWTLECWRILKPERCFYVWGTTKTDDFLHYKLKVLNQIEDFHYNNWIIWAYDWGGRTKKTFPRKHEDLLMYSKGKKFPFYTENILIPRALDTNINVSRKLTLLHKYFESIPFAEKDQHSWNHYGFDKLSDEALSDLSIHLKNENIRMSIGKIPTDVWSKNNHTTSAEYCRWHPTQKPLFLLSRIIQAHTNPGDIVVDPFAGTAATAIAASQIGRSCYTSEANATYYEKSLIHFQDLTNLVPLKDFP